MLLSTILVRILGLTEKTCGRPRVIRSQIKIIISYIDITTVECGNLFFNNIKGTQQKIIRIYRKVQVIIE